MSQREEVGGLCREFRIIYQKFFLSLDLWPYYGPGSNLALNWKIIYLFQALQRHPSKSGAFSPLVKILTASRRNILFKQQIRYGKGATALNNRYFQMPLLQKIIWECGRAKIGMLGIKNQTLRSLRCKGYFLSKNYSTFVYQQLCYYISSTSFFTWTAFREYRKNASRVLLEKCVSFSKRGEEGIEDRYLKVAISTSDACQKCALFDYRFCRRPLDWC